MSMHGLSCMPTKSDRVGHCEWKPVRRWTRWVGAGVAFGAVSQWCGVPERLQSHVVHDWRCDRQQFLSIVFLINMGLQTEQGQQINQGCSGKGGGSSLTARDNVTMKWKEWHRSGWMGGTEMGEARDGDRFHTYLVPSNSGLQLQLENAL